MKKKPVREPLTESETRMLLDALAEADADLAEKHAALEEAKALVFYHTRRQEALIAARDAYNQVMNR